MTQEEQLDRLRAFAQDVMEGWPEGDIDGGDLQEMAVRHGLLVEQEMTESCCEDCSCAMYGAFPQTCFRKTELLLLSSRPA